MRHILLIIVLFSFKSGYTQETSKGDNDLSTARNHNEFIDIIEKQSNLFPNNTQLSIAIVDGDSTQYIGVIRTEDKMKAIENRKSIFEIGSISKVFTSVLFSKQIHENNINLDDKLIASFPFLIENAPLESEEITLQMLANHTSGLPRIPSNSFALMIANPNNPSKDYTIDLLESYYKNEMVLENKPNTLVSYSNLGAGTLGYLLTIITKLPYEDLLQRDILRPLGMSKSTTDRTQIDQSQLVKGLYPDGSETSNWDYTDALVGAGGIKSSAEDMVKFIQKNFEDDVVYNLPQKPTVSVNEDLEVGLGWHISSTKKGKILWHNGGTGGYRSCLVLDKENKKAVLVLSNVSALGNNSGNIDILSFELIRKM